MIISIFGVLSYHQYLEVSHQIVIMVKCLGNVSYQILQSYLMQKLKVYLSKQEDARKTNIKRVKQRMLHSKSYIFEYPQINRQKSCNKSSQDKKINSSKNKQGFVSQTHNRSIKGNIAPRKHQSESKLIHSQNPNHNKSRGNSPHSFAGNHEKKIVKPTPFKIKQEEKPKKMILSHEEGPKRAGEKKNLKLKHPQGNRSLNNLTLSSQWEKLFPKTSKKFHEKLTETKKKLSKSAAIHQMPKIQGHQRDPTSRQSLIFDVMFRTRKGIQIMNPNKVNQDRFLIEQDLLINFQNGNSFQYDLYAVADGHGPCGHHVSHFIVQHLGTKIHYHLQNNFQKFWNQHKNSRNKLEEYVINKSLKKTFAEIQFMLEKNSYFNAEYSGSTLVVLLIDQGLDKAEKFRATCANVGDSRAIVVRQITKQNWEVIRLSDDHKPSRQCERKRILECGGRIQPMKDETGAGIGPLRVWLPKKKLQGLAMSRSLGDNISKPVGVSYEPQILTHEVKSEDKFIILASDGVWQFLSNYNILTLLIPYYRENKLEQACEALLKFAHQSWTIEQSSVVDDITFILIFISKGGLDIQQFQVSLDQVLIQNKQSLNVLKKPEQTSKIEELSQQNEY